MTIRIKVENPHSENATQLIKALSTDLGKRYGDSGAGAFTPDDVLVERAIFLVAYMNDTPVGCGALRPFSDATAEIKRMYVAPTARRKGIAGTLLTALESHAAQFNYRRVILETGTLQPEAIAFYEKAGYQKMDCYGEYVHDPHSICYEKPITG